MPNGIEPHSPPRDPYQLDRRLTIVTRSGIAANVVPNLGRVVHRYHDSRAVPALPRVRDEAV